MIKKVPDQCKKCPFLNKGIKDGKHNKWCCHYGRPVYKAIGQCKNEKYFEKLKKAD